MAHQSDLIADNIEEYLKQHENKELLRFITCGSVDDGKSTLIGRLLHDSKLIFEDHLAALEKDSKKVGTQGEQIDLALLVDGLQSEREQGITIDVAYRYFSTDKRKFIIADTPGHEQYTRNMATGASTADLAVILIDARKGVLTQTRRHSLIVHLLGIQHVILAVNKMDLVDYDQQRYEAIVSEYSQLANWMGISLVHPVPLSALKGDNVVDSSESMPWYRGPSLMHLLENIEMTDHKDHHDFRFPVQYVNRPDSEFRGFCGTVASGSVSVGDSVTVLPSGKHSRILKIVTYDGDLEMATINQAVTLILEDEIDISRGDLIVYQGQEPEVVSEVEAMVVWMHEEPLVLGKNYDLKRATTVLQGNVSEILYQVDLNTQKHVAAKELKMNGIGLCRVQLTRPIACDSYKEFPQTGSLIFIDRMMHLTVGAGMIERGIEGDKILKKEFSDFEIELNALIRKHFPHWEAKDISSYA